MLRLKTTEHRYLHKNNEEIMANDEMRKQLLHIVNTLNTSVHIKLNMFN